MQIEDLKNLDVVSAIKEHLIKERRGYAPRCNYASSAGHPCVRKLVYDRLNWEEKILPEPHSIMRMDDGKRLEKGVIDLIEGAGFEVVETQRPLEDAALQLSGRIEGRIKAGGKRILFEVKTVKDWHFRAINCAEDLLKSTAWWIRGYFDQFQLYLLLLSREPDALEFGFMFLKNLHGDIKQIRIDLNYEYAETVFKKLEIVNDCVKAKVYPDRIPEKKVCAMCDFRATCLPDEDSESLQIRNDIEIIDRLTEMDSLKAAAKRYDALNESWKKDYKELKDGTFLFGDFQVIVKLTERTEYAIPAEVKSQYAQKIPLVRATVTKLKGEAVEE